MTELADRWRTALRGVGDAAARPSLLYSGGLDSSVVAHSLRSRRPALVTVGVPGAADVLSATEGAALLDLPLQVRTIRDEDLHAALARWGPALAGASETERSVALGIALATEVAPTPLVVCGQGADELFLGYAHFEGVSTGEAERRAELDWRRLVDRDWPRARGLAATMEKDLVSPYLDKGFSEFVRAMPIEVRRGQGGRKPVLRQLARELGVPATLVDRPKKALQYGSGLARLLRRERQAAALG